MTVHQHDGTCRGWKFLGKFHRDQTNEVTPNEPGSKLLIGDGHPTFNRNPYNGYINLCYWVDDHPLLYGNIRSLDPSTNGGET